MKRYEPSTYIQGLYESDSMSLWECPGLKRLVRAAEDQEYTVYVDFDDMPIELELITPENVVRAVNEVEVAYLHFKKGEETIGVVMVIPSNGDDWLSDYHTSLDPLIDEVLPVE